MSAACSNTAWPGNVRELENAVERAMVVAQEPELREAGLHAEVAANGPGLGGCAQPRRSRERRTSCGCWKNAAATRRAPPRCLASIVLPLHHKLKKYGWNRRGERERTGRRREPNEEAATAAGGNRRSPPARMVASGFAGEDSVWTARVLAPALDPSVRLARRAPAIHSSEILAAMQTLHQPATPGDYWGSPSLDLYIPILTFVFGEAQIGGASAIVSYHRLRQEFYGLPARPRPAGQPTANRSGA